MKVAGQERNEKKDRGRGGAGRSSRTSEELENNYFAIRLGG